MMRSNMSTKEKKEKNMLPLTGTNWDYLGNIFTNWGEREEEKKKKKKKTERKEKENIAILSGR